MINDKKKVVLFTFIISCVLLISSLSWADAGASVLFNETNVGPDLWKYDYIFSNTSSGPGNWNLFNLEFTFGQNTPVTGSALPPSWGEGFGRGWHDVTGTNFRHAYSKTISDDITPGNSLSGFSFIINYQAGSIPFKAYFRDLSGTTPSYTYVDGTTAVAPEPVSSLLFLIGGIPLGLRRLLKRNNC